MLALAFFGQVFYYQNIVASLEKCIPAPHRNSLKAREGRQAAVLSVLKRTLPAQMGLHLRREERELHRAMLEAEDPDQKARLNAAACATRAQLFDLLGWPRRPASSPAKGRPEIPIEAAGSILATELPIPPSEKPL